MPETKIERRAHQGLEVREDGDGPPTLVGMPVVYDSESVDLGGFREIIRPGAFGDLASHDVRALVEHDPARIIGRTKSGTLQLEDTKRGLRAIIQPADTQAGRDVVTSVRRGDLDGMSFAFQVTEQRWTFRRSDDPDDLDLREILGATLLDNAIVAYPAYPDTSVALRSRDASRVLRYTTHWATREQLLRLQELEVSML